MHGFRKTFVCGLLLGLGATASAQDKAITLGQPTPLPGGVVRAGAFAPVTPDTGIQRASFGPAPRPSVVRGASDDLPKIDVDLKTPPPLFPVLPAPTEVGGSAAEPLPPAQPAKQDAQPAPAAKKPVQSVPAAKSAEKDAPSVIEVDTEGKVTVVPEPRFQPLKAKAPPPPVTVSEPTKVLDEHVIIVDNSGSPLWGGGTASQTRFYAQSEYLLWWTRGMHLPPLVLTDSPTTPIANLGVLGNGTSQLLYGNSNTSTGPNSGGRFTLGYTLDDCGYCTLEGSFFFLGRKNDNASFNSNQFPVLGRPFYDLNDGVLSREFTAIPLSAGAPFAATGVISVNTTSNLLGAEANLKSLLWCGCNYQVTGLVGFRYLDLTESVRITESSVQQLAFADVDASIRPGDMTFVFDNFATHNRFYGGQIGASGEWTFGRWSVEGSAKLGIGVTQQTVNIDGGQQIVSLDGRVQSFQGGLYAVPSNIGSHTQNQFGFVPEVGLKLNYQLTENISLFVGYDILYWSSVVRPGDQIDQVLDLNQVPNSGRPYPTASQVRPVVPFQTSSYWAQGVNAGVLFRY